MYTTYKTTNNGKTMSTEPVKNYTKNLRKEINRKDAERIRILKDLETLTNPEYDVFVYVNYLTLTSKLLDIVRELEAMQKNYDQVVKIRFHYEKESGIKGAVHYRLCIAKTEEERVHAKQAVENAIHRFETMFFNRVNQMTVRKYDVLTPID